MHSFLLNVSLAVYQDYYKALEDADEKVQLANQIYDLVSNFVSTRWQHIIDSEQAIALRDATTPTVDQHCFSCAITQVYLKMYFFTVRMMGYDYDPGEKVQGISAPCKSYADMWVSTQVDRHLRKLDQELAKFKMELEADNAGITEILERREWHLSITFFVVCSSAY